MEGQLMAQAKAKSSIFSGEITGIGSAPFSDPDEACKAILAAFTHIPFWPQLPKRSFLENMYVQYSERFPGIVVDAKTKSIHIDSAKAALEIEAVYGKAIEGDLDFFRISEDHAQGLYSFLKNAPSVISKEVKFLKGHITGPISFALSVTDEQKRSIIYNKDLFEVLVKVLVMKIKWQIRTLKTIFPDIIIFIDEPYLVSIGSSYVTINPDEVMPRLDETIAAIKEEGALSGIHCCGNTDWSLLLKKDIDIINFDAYNFGKEFSLYGPEIADFLEKGGTIAWGVVPSSPDIAHINPDALIEKLQKATSAVREKGKIRGALSSIITPSCGLGTLDEVSAREIFRALGVVRDKIKDGVL